MTDNSNNPNYQGNSAEGQNRVSQDKKTHETNENTYWEQEMNLSEVELPGEQQKLSKSASGQQETLQDPPITPQTPYLPNSSLPYKTQGLTSESTAKPGKKSRRILTTIIVTLLLLTLVTAVAYANRGTLLNSLARMTMSPAQYYSFIEKNNVTGIVDILTNAGESYTQEQETGYAYDFSADININHDTVDSMLESYLGTGLSDLEALLGIPLNQVSMDAIVGKDKDLISEDLSFSLNNVKLITAEIFLDTAANKMLLQLPELSNAYLSLTEGKVNPVDFTTLKDITPERTADLMKRYSNLIIDQINHVTLGDDKDISLEHLSGNCTELKVVMTAEDLYNIQMAVLAEARDDQYFKDLLSVYQVTEADYQNSLDEIQAEAENSKDMLEDLTMLVYVDAQGRILSRSITSEDSVATVGYTVLLQKNEIEYQLFLTDDTGSTVLNITGYQASENGVDNGNATITAADPDDSDSPITFDITYKDMNTKRVNDRNYHYGSITFSSLDLMGIQVILDLKAEENTQLCDIDVRMGAESLLTVNAKTEYLTDFSVTAPKEDAEVYDLTQPSEYMSTVNLEDYITRLSQEFGVDLQSLFGLYGSDTTE